MNRTPDQSVPVMPQRKDLRSALRTAMPLSREFIKTLHATLKAGTSDADAEKS